jgi:hypothetical protein
MNWQKVSKRLQRKGVVAAGETATGAYYEVRQNGEVHEDLGGSFNKIHKASSADEGIAFVEKRTKPSVDEDFPNGFPW